MQVLTSEAADIRDVHLCMGILIDFTGARSDINLVDIHRDIAVVTYEQKVAKRRLLL